MMRTRIAEALVAAAIVLTLSLAFAGHLAAVTPSFQITPAANPVSLIAGTNAGSTDVAGRTINVTVSPNGTAATVQLDLVYGENQYLDVLDINVSGAPWTIYVVADPTSSIFNPTYINLTSSKLIICNSTGAVIAAIPFSSLATGSPVPVGGIAITSNGLYKLDMIIYMNDGVPLPTTPFSLAMKIYYSHSSEQPITG